MRFWLAVAGVNGAIAVAMGALASHALSGAPGEQALGWVDTGARYQLAHALALLFVAVVSGRPGAASVPLRLAGAGFLAGSVLFCGGLYVMALAGWGWVGPVVPVGGLAFLLGWLSLLAAALGRGGR